MKRRKMYDLELFRFLEVNRKNGFYDSSRIKTKANVRGTLYKLCKPLTDNEKAELLKWKNVDICMTRCEYAPEIRGSAVIIYDKCVRV